MGLWQTLQRHPFAVVVAALAALVIIRVVVIRSSGDDERDRLRAAGLVLGIVAALVVAKVTLRGLPVPVDFPRRVELVPFQGAVADGTRSDVMKQMLGNVVLFVPFGVAGVLVSGRFRLRHAAVFAAGLSLLVETAQYAFVDGRVFETTDVLLNVAGSLVGYAALAGRPLAALRRPRTTPSRDQIRRQPTRT